MTTGMRQECISFHLDSLMHHGVSTTLLKVTNVDQWFLSILMLPNEFYPFLFLSCLLCFFFLS